VLGGGRSVGGVRGSRAAGGSVAGRYEVLGGGLWKCGKRLGGTLASFIVHPLLQYRFNMWEEILTPQTMQDNATRSESPLQPTQTHF